MSMSEKYMIIPSTNFQENHLDDFPPYVRALLTNSTLDGLNFTLSSSIPFFLQTLPWRAEFHFRAILQLSSQFGISFYAQQSPNYYEYWRFLKTLLIIIKASGSYGVF